MKKTLSVLLVLVMLFAVPALSAAVDSPEPETPPDDIEEIIEDLQTIYRLTIYYIYEDGTPAAPTYTEQLKAGTPYSVESPIIPGYTPTMEIVTGTMPAYDVEYTVVYIPKGPKTFKTIEDYETPLGLGVTYMHVGICIE